MVRLDVFSTTGARSESDFTKLPLVIGRNRDADLCLEREGIWDRHLEINLQMPEGFVLTVNPNASATVNGDPVRRRALRNGDAIQVGGTRLQFSLTPTRQTDLRVREFFTWLGLIFLCGVQVGLIYQVLR